MFNSAFSVSPKQSSEIKSPKERKVFTCDICERRFHRKDGIIRHIQTVHETAKQKSLVKCPLCDHQDLRHVMTAHYRLDHSIEVIQETLHFANITDFEVWKNELERDTVSKYNKKYCKKKLTHTYFNYRCHRDGHYKPRGQHVRQAKVQGSNKINGHCPSQLFVSLKNNTGEVTVKYIKTHVGHDNDLQRIRLTDAEKNFIVRQISQKVPFNDILENLRSNINVENGLEPNNRLNLITRKDLFNIQTSYNIKASTCKRTNHPVKMENVLKEMEMTGCSSIIRLYKGKFQTCGEHPELDNEDFLLVIMNDIQLETLKQYGSKCVFLESSGNLSTHTFELTTVTVLDEESGETFPCAFIFSNRLDCSIFEIIFKIMKTALGAPLVSTVFMSDLNDNSYSAWLKIMGPATYRLYSSWHVTKAWKQKVTQLIQDQEVRSLVLKTLNVMLKELDEVTFMKMVDKYTNSMKTDPDLQVFREYFQEVFICNVRSWAHCYRKQLGETMLANLDKMYKALRYFRIKGRNVKRVDHAINSIMRMARDNFYESHVEFVKELSEQLYDIEAQHACMELLKQQPLTEVQKGVWTISSSAIAGDHHTIIVNMKSDCECSQRCDECNICVHSFDCSCPDASMKWDMCVHMHLLGSHLHHARPTDHGMNEEDLEHSQAYEVMEEENWKYEMEYTDETMDPTVVYKESCESGSTTPQLPPVSKIVDLKLRLLRKFDSIVNDAVTIEKCRMIEGALEELHDRVNRPEAELTPTFSICRENPDTEMSLDRDMVVKPGMVLPITTANNVSGRIKVVQNLFEASGKPLSPPPLVYFE